MSIRSTIRRLTEGMGDADELNRLYGRQFDFSFKKEVQPTLQHLRQHGWSYKSTGVDPYEDGHVVYQKGKHLITMTDTSAVDPALNPTKTDPLITVTHHGPEKFVNGRPSREKLWTGPHSDLPTYLGTLPKKSNDYV